MTTSFWTESSQVMKRGLNTLLQKPSSTGSPCETKFKQAVLARKVMYRVFWDRLVPITTLTASVTINLSIKLGFVSVNGPRETYFVDAHT